MLRILALSWGGALETVARCRLNRLISSHQARHYPPAATSPLGTMVIGCFAISFLAATRGPAPARARLDPKFDGGAL